MKPILLLSPHPGAGVATVSVNLAAGLIEAGNKVLLVSMGEDPRLKQWLEKAVDARGSLLSRHPGLVWQQFPDEADFRLGDGEYPDYLLIMAGSIDKIQAVIQETPALILCIIDGVKHSCEDIMALDQQLKRITSASRGIDLLVPNKVQPGEWEESSRLLLCLGEQWGWERVADPLPYCEAIHDLPLEGKTVWELPAQYSNRQAAFQSLVEQVRQFQ
ncbi:MAG: hypothetical protein ACOX0F_10400 [Syntrophomonadaceae bacterium]|jgi:hypothetical protein